MSLPTNAQLPFRAAAKPPLRLNHQIIPLPNGQKRLEGRIALKPVLDLTGCKFRAVIDWIEFRVHFDKGTQVQHVQKVLRKYLSRDSHIEPHALGPGSVFDQCRIKIQEPKSFAAVAQITQDLADQFGAPKDSQVTVLEISIDAYPATASDAERGVLLGAMQRMISTDRDIWSNLKSRPRVVWARGRKATMKLSPSPKMDRKAKTRLHPDNHRIPFLDGTMYLGARDDDVMIRVMDKIKDKQKPDQSFDLLSDAEKRVRIEVTLQGGELPKIGVTTVMSLRNLNLSRFQGDYFKFMMPTFRAPKPAHLRGANAAALAEWQALRARTYLRSGVTGLMSMDDWATLSEEEAVPMIRIYLKQIGRDPKTAKPKRLARPFLAHSELNSKVGSALINLNRKQETAWTKFDSGKLKA
jgi:hypothetical protein